MSRSPTKSKVLGQVKPITFTNTVIVDAAKNISLLAGPVIMLGFC